MRMLVTGGAGFIGSHFVRHHLGESWVTGIRVLDALTYAGNPRNLSDMEGDPKLEFFEGDIRDRNTCHLMTQDQDVVVHFAAESHVDRSVEDASIFVETNIGGTHNLLTASLRNGIQRFLHVSTDEVYGSVDAPCTEDSPLRPSNPYAASKAASDLLVESYVRTHGLDAVITRCTNNYGPRQHPEKVIPRWVQAATEGKAIEVHGDGLHVREWIHVADHVRGVSLALRQGRAGQVYHVAGGTPRSNYELAHDIASLLGVSSDLIHFVSDRQNNDRRYMLDGSKAFEELGFEPTVPYTEGMLTTVEWYRENPHHWDTNEVVR